MYAAQILIREEIKQKSIACKNTHKLRKNADLGKYALTNCQLHIQELYIRVGICI